MSPTTAANVKLILLILSFIASAVLYTMSFINIKDAHNDTGKEELEQVHKDIMDLMIINYVIIFIVLALYIASVSQKRKIGAHLPFFVVAGIYILTPLLLVNGIVSAKIASQLQCLQKDSKKIEKAHTYMTSNAVLGVVGGFIIGSIHAYLQYNQMIKKPRIRGGGRLNDGMSVKNRRNRILDAAQKRAVDLNSLR